MPCQAPESSTSNIRLKKFLPLAADTGREEHPDSAHSEKLYNIYNDEVAEKENLENRKHSDPYV